jgi:hypothetical protein
VQKFNEQQIIDLILKQVIVMRELPLIKVTNSLERENEVKKINIQVKQLRVNQNMSL